MAVRDLDPEFERLMNNWAMYRRTGGAAPSGKRSSADIGDVYGNGLRDSRYRETTFPIAALEAGQVDRAMNGLDTRLSLALECYWLESVSAELLAQRCNCCEKTFYNRVDRGHEAVGVAIHKRVYAVQHQAFNTAAIARV